MKYSKETMQAIRTYLEEKADLVGSSDGNLACVMHFSGTVQLAELLVSVHETDYEIIVYFPIACVVENSSTFYAVSEFIHRINCCSEVDGHFEMDYDTGRIYYRNIVYFGAQAPNPDIIEHSIDNTEYAIQEYSSGFIGVIFRHMSPEKAESLYVAAKLDRILGLDDFSALKACSAFPEYSDKEESDCNHSGTSPN